MNLIAYGVGTQMQYVMVASAGQSDSIMQHAAGGEICQILMSRMEETGAPAAAGKVENGKKNPVPTRSVFYFLASVFVFMGSRFCIYGNGKGFFPSISARSRFYPELTRIYSVFHPVFNLCEICLEIDMFINLLITNYAC